MDVAPPAYDEKAVAEDKGVRPATADGGDQGVINVIENPLKVSSHAPVVTGHDSASRGRDSDIEYAR